MMHTACLLYHVLLVTVMSVVATHICVSCVLTCQRNVYTADITQQHTLPTRMNAISVIMMFTDFKCKSY